MVRTNTNQILTADYVSWPRRRWDLALTCLQSESWIQTVHQKSLESISEGLCLKIRTYLRAAQKAFLPTCQELLEVSLYISETGKFLCSRAINAWKVHSTMNDSPIQPTLFAK